MPSNYLTLSIIGKDVSAGKTIQDVGKAVDTVAGKLSTVGDRLAKVGDKMTMKVTLPLVAIGVGAVNTEKNFSKAMAQIGVAADVSGSDLDNLADYAKQMGSDTVFSAGEAADAMLELAKGGFNPAQISGGGLATTMALAAAGGLQLADAANVTSAAMNTFGMKAKDAGQIADALAGGANASSADVSDLGMALSQVGSAASAMSQDLNGTVGVLAAMADKGIKGSDAGTSLKTMLLRLVPATAQASDAMKELGLDFSNADGTMKSLPEVAGILQDKLKGLTQEQRISALATVFGTDAMRASLTLYDLGTDGVNKYVDATKAQGSAQKMADAQMSGSAGALEKMSGSIETAALSIGEALAPTVIHLANKIGELADWFTNLDPDMQQSIITVAALVAGIGPLLSITGRLSSAFGTGISVTKKVVGGLSALVTGFGTTGKAARGFLGPMGAIGQDLGKFTRGTRDAIAAGGRMVVSLGKQTAAMIANKAQTVALAALYAKDFAIGLAKSAGALIATTGRMIAQTAANVAARAATLAASIAQGIATAAQWLWNIAMNANPIGLIITAIGALVAAIIWIATQTTWFQDIWKAVTAALAAAWQWLWGNVLKPIFDGIGAVFNWLWGNIIQPVVNFIVAYVKLLGATFSWLWANVIQPTIKAVGAIFDWLWKNVIQPIFKFVGAAASNVGKAIHAAFSGVANFVGSVFRNVANFVAGGINRVIDLVNGAIGVINQMGRTASSITGGAISWKIGRLPRIPMLAAGGIASAATIAMIGEGPEPEVVQPLSNLKRMLGEARNEGAPEGEGGGFHLTMEMRNGPTIGEVVQDALWAAQKAGWRPKGKTA